MYDCVTCLVPRISTIYDVNPVHVYLFYACNKLLQIRVALIANFSKFSELIIMFSLKFTT